MTDINFEDEYNKLKYIINSGKINDYIFTDLYKGGYINIRDIKGTTTLINITYTDTVNNLMDKIETKNGMKIGTKMVPELRPNVASFLGTFWYQYIFIPFWSQFWIHKHFWYQFWDHGALVSGLGAFLVPIWKLFRLLAPFWSQ